MQEFGAIFILMMLSFIFAFCMLIFSIICAPKTKNEIKEQPYECGNIVNTDSRIKYNIQFLNYAILFLIFDIETIFLFPFAISYEILGIFSLIEITIFIGLLVLGLIYAIRKKLLRFN